MCTLAINTTIQMEAEKRMLGQKREREITEQDQAHVTQMLRNKNRKNKGLHRACMH